MSSKRGLSIYLWILIGAVGLYWLCSYWLAQRDWQVNQEMSAIKWQPVAGVELPDITAMAFDKSGIYGVAASSEGMLIATKDGGRTWQPAGQAPLGDGEMVTAMGVIDTGEVIVAAGVDESAWTAIYHKKLNGEWERITGQLGGIGSACIDGEIFVGGNGLIARYQGQQWSFSKMPGGGVGMLYGIARYEMNLIAAGDKGQIFLSVDNGSSWTNSLVDTESKSSSRPLYAAAISEQLSLVGGSAGSFWYRSGNDSWKEIKGLSDQLSIFALYLSSDASEIFAAGGADSGGSPFIICSLNGGRNWQFEAVGLKSKGRIVAIARGNTEWFAATLGGRILMRGH